MRDTNHDQTTGNILIVDDTPANLRVLSGMLKDEGYKVRPVPSGTLALRAAKSDPPDLILLDIMMPEMDGYETCQKLKESEQLREIPVIFISALNEVDDKVKAFQNGGVDYITKPFQFEEVHARVDTHLRIQQQKQELRQRYKELQQLEAMRENLTDMIVHDMRNPLSGISGFLELLQMTEESNLSDKGKEFVHKARNSSEFLIDMTSSLLDLSKLESGEMNLDKRECELQVLIREAYNHVESLTEEKRVELDLPDSPHLLSCDAELIKRVIQNLIGNALKFTSSDGSVSVSILNGDGETKVAITDSGPGIPEDYREKIFEKFGQVEARQEGKKYSTGIGLSFCKLAVESHGGEIDVDSEVGRGSTFWFTIPSA